MTYSDEITRDLEASILKEKIEKSAKKIKSLKSKIEAAEFIEKDVPSLHTMKQQPKDKSDE